MNIHEWKLYDKSGSPLNWTPSPLITLNIESPTGKDAEGYFITDPSLYITGVKMLKGGYLYDNDDITVSYIYKQQEVDITSDCSIFLTDVSIFNPEGTNTKSISGINVDISALFIYPAATYAAAIFLRPVSVGLVETEHLFILEASAGTFIRPYDNVNSTLVFEFIGDETEIAFFTVNEATTEITWSDTLEYDLSVEAELTPLTLNIGFRSEFEGVFERILRVYHLVGNTLYIIADIVVNAEAIGEDERFRTLLTNFGLPDPKSIPQIFKESDINEDLPDWDLLNYKSKHMILEHDKIMPYIGTYKALINAIKWLGYDDIGVREWFLNVKEHSKLSFVVPYNATDRTQTILMFNEDQRKVLKKLNQLTLTYCLTRETGERDVWGTPLTENCYAYNLKEIFVKLLGLKTWLEKNIIGVNCRIVDFSGEGIYFERVQNLIYATDNQGYEYRVDQTLTPYGPDESSELVTGDASLRLTFLELTNTKLSALNARFIDYADSAWHPDDPSVFYSLDDPSYLADPSSFLLMGATFAFPFRHIDEIMWRASVEKENAGVLGNPLVSPPLFILENDIRFLNVFDSSAVFHDASTSLTIYLEKAYLRDPSLDDEWDNNIAYTITPNASANGYTMEASSGTIYEFDEYVALNPGTNPILQYAIDDNFKVPLLSFKNFSFLDASGTRHNFETNRLYHLDILDGKIEMNAGMETPIDSSDNAIYYLNFNYDTSLEEQMITVNVVYTSPRMSLFLIDPSVYYWADPSVHTGTLDPSVYLIDNSIYTMHTHHIGNYNLELFAWDAYNTLFYNRSKKQYLVWIKEPTIYTGIDNSIGQTYEVSTYLTQSEVEALVAANPVPLYDRYIPLQGLEVKYDSVGRPYIEVPSITYFQDVPEPLSFNRFFNLTERVLTIAGNNITVDNDYQTFVTGDDVRLVAFNKADYDFVAEASSHILSASGSEPTSITLDNMPSEIVIDSSTDVYILNDTHRSVSNITNISSTFTLDVSGYTFLESQIVGVIVTDLSTNYSWGASYQVLEVTGSTHTLDGLFPNIFLANPGRYETKIKHAFSTYSAFEIETDSATEENNAFKIYLKNSYCQEHYLDNTFIYMNVPFDQEKVNDQWYDPSMGLINSDFYMYEKAITTDVSTLVILRALYEPSTYLLNQRNIWTVRENETNKMLFKVFNESIPYVFDETGNYIITAESYDSYGNLIESNKYITLR